MCVVMLEVSSDVCCEVEISAKGRSSAQRTFTECDNGTSTKSRPCPTRTFDS
jgi:hypothetical protein